MAIGLVGYKRGMTRIFSEDGVSHPITVVEVSPNKITQIKTDETDGYNAVQITMGLKKQSRVTKPEAGHFAKAKVDAGVGLWEFRADAAALTDLALGGEIKVDILQDVKFVDVTGTSKGKGFAGVIKRHNFSSQDATHGNSLSHRAAGSIGQNQSPGRVFKGKKMAGQMGNKRSTTQNLELLKVDVEKNLLMIKGAIPGATGGIVIVKPAVKKVTAKDQ